MKIKKRDGSILEAGFEEELGKNAFRHTAAHILAQAVKRLYPDTKCAIGPSIADGFYYDFDFSFRFSEENFAEIEAEMKKIVKENLQLKHFIADRKKAMQIMKERGETYKIEMLQELSEGEEISFYQQGEYLEMCAGPHVAYTSLVKAFKLLSVAGAYWRGDEKNKMLTRIYGTAFPSQDMLEEYLNRREEAKKRDHRKLGKELGLFALFEEGPGFPFFLPKGLILKNLLVDYWRKLHAREGYVEISTPIILNRQLWETSGHWGHYRENMYTTVIDETDFAIKPMNCPGGMLVYKMAPHSYNEFPMRIGELGIIHRNEKSGTLHGLMRVRCCTQDDAHIFMTPGQITDEIKGVIRLIDEVYSDFGFKYHVELSTRPDNSIGSDKDWEMATNGLKSALDELKMPYIINEGDGAFYGPKIDFHLEDSIGRTWQCGTIQLDFQLPQRFEAEYTGEDGNKHRPIMIHRVVFGSIERFIGILIEHFAGKFPLWLSPVQVKILSISDKYNDYAKEIENILKREGLRCEVDGRAEKIGYKIRAARLERIPYLLIVGEKEVETDCVSVRKRDDGDLGSMPIGQLLEILKEEGI
ncbi:MAG: threonine--tRNA ligase [Lachnospiraceae bacterium]|jgi:threonyl-tRNA synthetase|nr:threonine--tRNA ligase [Lachnospiraceae bacterium]